MFEVEFIEELDFKQGGWREESAHSIPFIFYCQQISSFSQLIQGTN